MPTLRPYRLPLPGLSALAALLIVVAATPGYADEAALPAADETAMTAGAVIAVDEHWSRAEEGGDVDWLEQMLMPEYRSISPTGVAKAKAAIVAGAKKNRSSEATRLADEVYSKAHPYKTFVVLQGDVAILSFYNPALGAQNGVLSSDIFI